MSQSVQKIAQIQIASINELTKNNAVINQHQSQNNPEKIDELQVTDTVPASSDEAVTEIETLQDDTSENNTEQAEDGKINGRKPIENLVSLLLSQGPISTKSTSHKRTDCIFGQKLKRLNVLHSNCDIMLEQFIKARPEIFCNNNNDIINNKNKNNKYKYDNKTAYSFMDTTICKENIFDNMIKTKNQRGSKRVNDKNGKSKQIERGKITPKC